MLHKLGIRENGDNLWLSLKRRLPPPSAWLWATLWSAVFTALFLRTLYSEKCFAVTHGPDYLGPIDGFLIEITPVWRVCTFRSFTAAEDGQIHSTFEYRPATKADPAIQ